MIRASVGPNGGGLDIRYPSRLLTTAPEGSGEYRQKGTCIPAKKRPCGHAKKEALVGEALRQGNAIPGEARACASSTCALLRRVGDLLHHLLDVAVARVGIFLLLSAGVLARGLAAKEGDGFTLASPYSARGAIEPWQNNAFIRARNSVDAAQIPTQYAPLLSSADGQIGEEERVRKTGAGNALGSPDLTLMASEENTGASPRNSAKLDSADTEDLPLLEGEGITFTATVETTQQIRRIGKEEIQRLQAPDTTSLLERAFHLGITRNGPYGSVSGVSLRGYGSGRVAILVDGVPVNSLQTGGFDLNRLSPDDLEGVEVIYGGADTRFAYSGAQGGVINLITRRLKEEGSRFDITLTNQFPLPEPYVAANGDRVWPSLADLGDTQKLRVGWETFEGSSGIKAGLEVVRAGNHFLFQDPQYKIRRRTGAGVQDLRGDISYLWDPGKEQSLLLSGSFYWGDKDVPGPLYSTNPGTQEDLYFKSALHYRLGALSDAGANTEMVFTYSYEGTDYTDSTGTTIQGLHTIQGISRWEIPSKGKLTYRPSVDATYGYLDSSNLGVVSRPEGGLSLGIEYAATEKLTLIPFLKMVITETTVMPVPKLGILYRISDSLTVKHNWFRTFRLPTLNDLYWPEDSFAKGNPDLKPEDGVGTDLILEMLKPGAYLLEASFYATYQKDAISWQPGSGGKWTPTNIAEALYFGSDWRVSTDVHPTLKLTATYGWLLTYVLTGTLTLRDDKRMPYQPVHRFGAGVEVLWNTGSLVITQKYESERYATIVNAAPLAPYFTLDVSLTQKLGDSWTLLISGANLLGANYQLIENYPLPRTTVSVGLRFSGESKPRKQR